jgi:hypothetical protein
MIVSSNRSLLKKTNGSIVDNSPDIERDELHDSSVEIGHLQTLKSKGENAKNLDNCNCKSPPSSIGKASELGSMRSKWKTSR